MSKSSHRLVYLDHAAAAPLLDVVTDGHEQRCRQFFFNPHSTHQYSEACQRELIKARRRLLDLLGTDEAEAEVVWTSGGTEANNLGILGCLREQGDGTCLVEATAHMSVLNPCRAFGNTAAGRADIIPVTTEGRLQLPPGQDRGSRPVRLVALGHVNNETGVVHDLTAVRGWMRQHTPGAYLLVDALQSFGKLSIPWQAAEIDMLSIGGRKIGGPANVGALVFRRGTPLQPLFFGGDQQNSLRPGTVDTVGVLEFVDAASSCCRQMSAEKIRVEKLNTLLRKKLLEMDGGVAPVVVSPPSASPFILNVAFPGLEGAVLMRALALRNVIIATGSACSAEAAGISHVLTAMGLPRAVARGAVRISFGHGSTSDDVDALAAALAEVIQEY
jgi:cysteine desulfurase